MIKEYDFFPNNNEEKVEYCNSALTNPITPKLINLKHNLQNKIIKNENFEISKNYNRYFPGSNIDNFISKFNYHNSKKVERVKSNVILFKSKSSLVMRKNIRRNILSFFSKEKTQKKLDISEKSKTAFNFYSSIIKKMKTREPMMIDK